MHPAHVHLFKNCIWELQERNHNVYVFTRKKDVVIELLNHYKFQYIVLDSYYYYLHEKIFSLVKCISILLKHSKSIEPDIFIGGGPAAAFVSKIRNATKISFGDSELALKYHKWINLPFVNFFLTPSCYKKDIGKKQIRYNGYHELAYLHPSYFFPNPNVISKLGINIDKKFIIMRFVSWKASHDYGQHGLNNKSKRNIVRILSHYANIYITSEESLPEEFISYQIQIPPEEIHNALYYASLYVGEGATMASESAVLGTPAIYVNSISAGTIEEQQKYGLIFHYLNEKDILHKGIEILKNKSETNDWKVKRNKLISEKINVTEYLVNFIEELE